MLPVQGRDDTDEWRRIPLTKCARARVTTQYYLVLCMRGYASMVCLGNALVMCFLPSRLLCHVGPDSYRFSASSSHSHAMSISFSVLRRHSQTRHHGFLIPILATYSFPLPKRMRLPPKPRHGAPKVELGIASEPVSDAIPVDEAPSPPRIIAETPTTPTNPSCEPQNQELTRPHGAPYWFQGAPRPVPGSARASEVADFFFFHFVLIFCIACAGNGNGLGPIEDPWDPSKSGDLGSSVGTTFTSVDHSATLE